MHPLYCSVRGFGFCIATVFVFFCFLFREMYNYLQSQIVNEKHLAIMLFGLVFQGVFLFFVGCFLYIQKMYIS